MAGTSSKGGRWDHEITKGASWSVACTWLTQREPTEVARDITAGTFSVIVKTAEDSSGTLVATLTATIVSGAAGTFTVSQTAAQVAALTAGAYWWSATFTPSGGEAEAAWHGRFTVRDLIGA